MNAPAPFERLLYVSRPVLPPLADYTRLLETIWESRRLTNMGPLHEALERAIGERIGVGHTSLWSNGAAALIGALDALELTGSVVVTPFTFPATVHAIALLGLEPVFADIDGETLTLDPASVRERLDERTSAILATHVYGTTCDVDGLGAIAREHDLRVVYDGAHSFARPAPIFAGGAAALGDVTMLSFHATKLFHSVEGGALVTADGELDRRFRLARNFGIKNEDEGEGVGLNGKMSELHAAMGLGVMELLDAEIARRGVLAARYRAALSPVGGLSIVGSDPTQYLIVRVDADGFGSRRDDLHATLRAMNVVSRRYFYPLCSDLPAYAHLPSARHLPRAGRAAAEVLALPFHGGLSTDDVERIAEIIAWHHRGGRP